MSKRKSKELDHYLKHIIDKVPEKIENFINSDENKITYYTGNWAKDVVDNYTEKQAEKIFKKMSSFSDRVLFFQKRNKNIDIGTWSEYGENLPESISSYDYICVRSK